MRKYTLASPNAKTAVDLWDYAAVIEKAVHEVLPESTVRVEKACYLVDPTPGKGDAIKIGRLICQSKLKKHCIQIPKLFSSIEIDPKEEDHE